jgi:uncharacterized Zn-binding protein involved in type VI secretion
MIPIARQTDLHTCLIPIHGVSPIIPVGGTVSVNGIAVARVGDMTGCGAVIVSGFPHILVDGRPMAHVGSLSSHGGTIVTGSHDCAGGEVNFMTSKLVVDFERLGAINDAGVVNEALMAELLADPQLEQRAQGVGALVQSGNAPSLIANFSRSFLVTDSDTGRPLTNRAYTAVVDGHQVSGVTDDEGFIQVAAAKADSVIKLHVEFSSPTRSLTELSEGGLAADRVITLSQAQYVRPGQPQAPVVVTVNDRAATREALIRKVRGLGHQFVERSEWKAKPAKAVLDKDWDYSMIALHHAGRSYSCGRGAQQMLDVQKNHQSEYDDIGYHFGIDCEGTIYEGRDIRCKGSSLLRYNTGVIGIVLLNNLTTVAEGEDWVAVLRSKMQSVGMDTSHEIPNLQASATANLINTLKDLLPIKHFGGHKEFPNQYDQGKICPGNIGMELVLKIRKNTQLSAPPHA